MQKPKYRNSILSAIFCFFICIPQAIANPSIFLTNPACFPSCTIDDMRLLLKSSEAEKQVIDAIQSAKSDIRFSVYTFSRFPIFKALIDSALTRGVKIKGLVDRAQLESLNPYCKDGQCDLTSLILIDNFDAMPFIDKMGIISNLEIYKKATLVGKLQLLSYRNEDLISIRVGAGSSRLMHNKFLIIDHEIVQASSGNWSSTAMSVNFENTWIFNAPDDQRQIDSFLCAFDAIWDRSPTETSKKLSFCRLDQDLYFTPDGGHEESIENVTLKAIASATQSIDISMHHLAHPIVYEYLKKAAERGIKLRLLFDDDDCPNWMPKSLFELYSAFQNQVEVRYLPTECTINQLSHNRFGIFDNKLLINGSANWSLAGFRANYESFQVSSNSELVTKMEQHFEMLFSSGKNRKDCHCSLKEEACRKLYCRGEFSLFPR